MFCGREGFLLPEASNRVFVTSNMKYRTDHLKLNTMDILQHFSLASTVVLYPILLLKVFQFYVHNIICEVSFISFSLLFY